MPQCSRCGTSLPIIDARALWYQDKRVCRTCAQAIDVETRSYPREISKERPPSVEAGQQVVREVFKEREIIREIVKIRCRHCGGLFEERLDRCPHCGAGS